MLQRVYGTAWRSKKELGADLARLKEAARRDHRRFGREMALFHFQAEAAGSVYWRPGGAKLYLQERSEDTSCGKAGIPTVGTSRPHAIRAEIGRNCP